ncbi:CoA ester lyase [Mycoplasmatota bacterium]|nr:CoA ester lyase [Mycoplasmatota bacterium]
MSSYLFVPGNNPGMVQSAHVFDAKGVIFDLEDAVSVQDKDSAKDLLKAYLETAAFDNVYIRVNDIYDLGKNEIEEFNNFDISGYVIPKANTKVMSLVEKYTNKSLIPIIETPEAVLTMKEIGEFDNVTGMLLGGEDLATNIDVVRTLDDIELLYARHKLVMVCAYLGIDSIDTPFTDTDNDESLEESVKYSKMIGMSARSSIHPNQIPIINEIYKPTLEEIEFATKVVEAAKINDSGVFSVDGKMVDLPVIIRAKNILKKAKAYEKN